ncbi:MULTISPECIES: NADPH:quinone oxidoreductase family protein [Marinobacter]|mgnify:FL=1|jgi:NADPH2:quinone reductase|uniref:NADPH:quinone oxidoreductase n=1 Tax=Marinobacter vinifirmus TaxID=355591 RepID=A0A7Z1DZR9_9GAMM|nr:MULTISPECIES: NADPH:quinone oxidoreductase family protein [Marinobacter]OZC37820.1 NADPH:quinone oxidoreductase [Marinobacter vinifirmus]HBM48957.1 NADPH:quinone oxidoreductase family protein [Marinobacter sp.]|tara:strand:+ start:4994 stop:5974 length:981 start_codon:yes stop_codon:yes gene_type:complete
MKAILCKEYGPAETLVIEDVPSPKMGDRGVKIRVKAAGLNFPDTLIIEGKYQLQPPMPFSPGGELAGEVIEVGDKVTRFKPGDRVAALTGFGAFAEEVVAPESNLLPVPDNMPDEKAAGFMMVYGTSYYALKQRANLQPGETLLVLGASGGVGLAAVELGKAMGAKVIAAASSSEKLRIAKDAGADELINYTDEPLKDAVKKLTKGKGVDVIYDPVGGDFTEQALRTMAWNGRHLIIGFAAGDIPKVPANLTLLKGCSVVGVFWGAFTRNEPEVSAQNMMELLQMYSEGKIDPKVSEVFDFEQYAEALGALTGRRATGKVVLRVGA